MLKHFYAHLFIFIIMNGILILVSANVFGEGETDFADWRIYFVTFFWGIGMFCHTLYVLFEMYIKDSFINRWEEKKIKQFLEEDNLERGKEPRL